jgi:putative tricarboxylic transport membrane protein
VTIRRLATGDLVSGAVLAGLGGYIVVQAWRWDYLGPDGPGPGFFPLWYGVAMIGLALVLMARSARRPPSAEASPRPPVDVRRVPRALVGWAAVAVCVGLLKVLGFLLAFALLTFFVRAVMYRRPVVPALAVAVGAALGFYLVFPLALNVALPVGLLGF